MRTYTCLMAALMIVGCGSEEQPWGNDWFAGKGEGMTKPNPYGNTTNDWFTTGVESNLPAGIVGKMTRMLQQQWVEDHDDHWYLSKVKEEEIEKVIRDSADLMREFGDLLGNENRLKRMYQGLREILHNGAAIERFRPQLERGRYREVYNAYVNIRPSLLDQLNEDIRPPAGALPTIVINIPAEKIQAFYQGRRVQENKIVVGRPEYDGYDMNSKTRVGDHTIKEWVHCYSNAEYPSWCNSKTKGAFGEWTAKLDRSYQYIHGTVGNGVLDWFAIRTASGSHGCIRNQNKDIERLKQRAPVGSWVRKIYVRYERTMSVTNKNNNSSTNNSEDIFDQDRLVSFKLKKHDNLYKYNTGSTPASLPASLRLAGRPNGVYYPQNGVAVGYAHPTDAMTSALSGGSAPVVDTSQCDALGGTCQEKSTCGGTVHSNMCMGLANSIKCCVN